MAGLQHRFRDERPIFGLPPDVAGRRWVSRDGGPGDLALAHGEPRPHPSPLIVVGVMSTSYEGGSLVDVHHTLGTMLLLAERRNDPAFQYDARDQSVIERELGNVPGPHAWRRTWIEVDGSARSFARLNRGDDWIAFWRLGDECVYVHAQQPDGSAVRVSTVSDIAPYEDIKAG